MTEQPDIVRNKDDEPVILAMDTSSKATSLAIARGEKLLRSTTADHSDSRSERLWSDIESLLSGTGFTIDEVELFAVCVGPGGFTGLRVGVAASKGLAQAAGRPVVGVTSLEAVALEARPSRSVCAMVNAYKGDVYWQLFSFEDGSMPLPRSAPQVSSQGKIIESVAGIDDLVIVSDDSVAGGDIEALEEKFKDAYKSNAPRLRVKRCAGVRVEKVAQLGFMKYVRGEAATPAGLRACYVRPAEAEVKLALGLLGSKIQRSLRQQ
jgi:tRNA threonylcarbamoyladenosine biosynthesis protein TsaB